MLYVINRCLIIFIIIREERSIQRSKAQQKQQNQIKIGKVRINNVQQINLIRQLEDTKQYLDALISDQKGQIQVQRENQRYSKSVQSSERHSHSVQQVIQEKINMIKQSQFTSQQQNCSTIYEDPQDIAITNEDININKISNANDNNRKILKEKNMNKAETSPPLSPNTLQTLKVDRPQISESPIQLFRNQLITPRLQDAQVSLYAKYQNLCKRPSQKLEMPSKRLGKIYKNMSPKQILQNEEKKLIQSKQSWELYTRKNCLTSRAKRGITHSHHSAYNVNSSINSDNGQRSNAFYSLPLNSSSQNWHQQINLMTRSVNDRNRKQKQLIMHHQSFDFGENSTKERFK